MLQLKNKTKAVAHGEVFLPEAGLREGSLLSLSVSRLRPEQLLLVHQDLWVVALAQEGVVIARHGLQDVVVGGEQDGVTKLIHT